MNVPHGYDRNFRIGITRGLADLGPDDLGTQYRLVESQLTVQLGDRGRLGLQIDHRVDTFGLLVDLVREAPAAPHVKLLHRATRGPDHVQVLVERWRYGALLETAIEDHHDFVMTQDVLTSSGLGGRGPSTAGGSCVVPLAGRPGEPTKDSRTRRTDKKRPRGASSACRVGPGEERPHQRHRMTTPRGA